MKLLDIWEDGDYNFFLQEGHCYMKLKQHTGDNRLVWAVRADALLPQPIMVLFREECERGET